MRKCLFLFLLLIPFDVFAVSYTDYSDYNYSYDYVEANDLTEVTIERRYKYFKEVKEYSDYLDEINNDYPYITEDYLLSDLVYSSSYPDFDVIDLKEIPYTSYKEFKKVRYIKLDDFITNGNVFLIKEIDVIVDNTRTIDFDVICDKCSDEMKNAINTGGYDNSCNVTEDMTIILDLIDYYDYDDLYISIIVAGSFKKNFEMNITANDNIDFTNYSYAKRLTGALSSLEMYNIYISDFDYYDYLSDIKYIEGDYYGDNIVIISKDIAYSYYKKLYKYYRIIREYLDDYYVDVDGYIKDESNYIDVYKYRTRNMIEDNIVYVEVPVEMIKEIEVPIYIEKIVEVPTYVEKIVEVPVEMIKEIEVPVDRIKEIEVPIYRDKEIYIHDNKKDNNIFRKYFVYFIGGFIFKRKLFYWKY